ncbi:helix-turn-helix domain-containing protein [Bythopirellula polymerisocia]|uniref:Helix-turn-helix domain protein n=1 Tax=Bythopirellula polymerisocia TaxID=2528003 RepID=A0A5C6CMF2_9BACT|nr:Helix-turn-helix domain protein [Bythopirellula polymerisocia]
MPFIKAKQAAELVDVSERTILLYAKTGMMPAHRVGPKLWRFCPDEIDAWMRATGPRTETRGRKRKGAKV